MPKSKGHTLGVYMKNDIVEQHAALAGRKFYVERTAPDGSVYKDVYEVPDSLSAFARDSIGFTLDIIRNWREVPAPRKEKQHG